MAKITIAGEAIVITSSKSLDALKLLEEQRPNILRVVKKDEDGNTEEEFTVATTSGKGSISQYGATFASATHDAEKLATITVDVPAGVTDVKEYAAKVYGKAITMLNKIEAGVDSALEDVAREKAAVMAAITVV